MESSTNQSPPVANDFAWPEQTEVVAALLAINEWATEERRQEMPELDEIREFNIWAYDVDMPDGHLVLIEEAYHSLVEHYEQQLKALGTGKRHMPTHNAEQVATGDLVNKVTAAAEALDYAQAFKRTVFSWWTVPYWLAQKLIKKQEVVLIAYGSCWWGITDPAALHPATMPVLRTIYQEVQIAEPTNSVSNDHAYIT